MQRLSWLKILAYVIFQWGSFAGIGFAQTVTISGYVEDSSSGERIPAASVFIPKLHIGATTNQYGFYSLTTDSSSYLFMVSHIGYDAQFNRLHLLKDTTVTFTLNPRVMTLEDMEVVAPRETAIDEIQMSRHEISIEEIEILPVVFGEIDIQKTLQLLPGVQSGIEGSSGLYIRGGRADQNLILLDGLPLYNPNHLFGFFSVFNASAMKGVELIKGGFPARFGGRLSSVVNYTMKEGNLKRFGGESSLGLISSRLMIEGPIAKNRASFLLAGRSTYINPFLRLFSDPQNEYRMGFYDLNFKANYILSQKNRFYVSAYAGQDKFSFLERRFATEFRKFAVDWHNRLVSLRWNWLIGDHLFANSLLGITQYRFRSTSESEDLDDSGRIAYENSWLSEILDWTAKIDFEYAPNPRHYLRFGAEGILHRFSPGTTQTRLDESNRPPLTLLQTPTGILPSLELALYVEDEIQVLPILQVSTGIRLSGYSAQEKQSYSIEPRFALNVRAGNHTAIKASFARSKQYIHLLTGGGAAIPTDLWIPSMERLSPQKGYQIALGIVNSIQDGRYQVSIEGYYKRMRGNIEYTLGSDRFRSAFFDWPDLVENGLGSAYGLELFIRKKHGYLRGWAGYTWARSVRQFPFLNQGQSFPDGYDRRHDISIVLQYQLSESTHISAAWIYGSGYPVWVYTGRFAVGAWSEHGFGYPYSALETGPVNSARAPNYHRLDFTIHFKKQRSWAERTITLGVYNAYNRQNPMFIYPRDDDSSNTSVISYHQLSLLQLIPALSLQYSF